MKNLFVTAAVIFVSLNAQADGLKQKIVSVVNQKGETAVVESVATDGALSGMEVTGVDYHKTFTTADVAKGVVLFEQDKYKVLLLKGTVDARTQEGSFTMSYLFNAPLSTYKTCNFTLRRDNTGWFIENAYTNEKPITTIKVVQGSMGVDTLQGICPTK